EIIFPSKIPAELVTSLFTFNDDIEVGNWSFDRIYLSLDGDEQLVDVIIKSDDNRRQIKAKTDKSQTYEQLISYLVQDHKELEEYITLQTEDKEIYNHKEEKKITTKT